MTMMPVGVLVVTGDPPEPLAPPFDPELPPEPEPPELEPPLWAPPAGEPWLGSGLGSAALVLEHPAMASAATRSGSVERMHRLSHAAFHGERGDGVTVERQPHELA
jgi:hypothetical protein